MALSTVGFYRSASATAASAWSQVSGLARACGRAGRETVTTAWAPTMSGNASGTQRRRDRRLAMGEHLALAPVCLHRVHGQRRYVLVRLLVDHRAALPVLSAELAMLLSG